MMNIATALVSIPRTRWTHVVNDGAHISYEASSPNASAVVRFAPRLARRLYARACFAVAASDAVRADLESFLRPDSPPVVTIPNPVDFGRVTAKATGPAGSPPVFVNVGAYSLQKNQFLAIEAFRQFRHRYGDAELVLVGYGENEYELRAALQRLGLLKSARLLALTDPVPVFMAADAMVHTAAIEGFGLVLAEAMVCGLPVVCNHSPGAAATLGEAGLIVEPSDPFALAEAMHQVVSKPQARQSAIQLGRERARSFEPKTIAKAWLAALERFQNPDFQIHHPPSRAKPRTISPASVVLGATARVPRLGPAIAAKALSRVRGRNCDGELPVTRRGLRWKLDLRDNLQRELFYLGVYDAPLLREVGRRVRADDVILDIGSNIGAFAVPLARQLSATAGGRVYAIEPAAAAAARLAQAVVANRVQDRVFIDRLAFGNEPGDQVLRANPRFGAADLGTASLHGAGPAVDRVKVVRGDDWATARGVARVDIMKLDVEGAEVSVLQGLTGLMVECPPRVVAAEVITSHPARAGARSSEVVRMLRALGYDLYWIRARGLQPMQDGAERDGNLLGLRREQQST
jgi:FkbM family methyltransferase